MLLSCLTVGTLQLFTGVRSLLRARARTAGPVKSSPRPAAVIIPCKGAREGLAGNAAALLGQDYPAGAEFIFVTPSRNDPAWDVLHKAISSNPGVKAELTVSNAVPERCGEHILNKLHGLSSVSEKSEVLVFADSDVRVPPGWLALMTAPLEDPSVGAVTAPLVFLPGRITDICGNLRCAWEAAGIPYLDLGGCVTGASFSIRRKDFEGLGIREMWSRSLSDDLSLSAGLRKAGMSVRFAYGALPSSAEDCEPLPVLGMFNKWMTLFKFYSPMIWTAGAALTAFKLYAVLRGFLGLGWLPAAALFAADALYVYIALSAVLGRRPERTAGAAFPFISIIAALLLQPLYAANFLASLFSCRVRWGGYTYRVRGPERITVEPR